MRNTLKAALLVSSALIATPVLAQQQPTPPEHYTLDAQGVDLVQGTFNYSAVDVAIGPAGDGGIVHGRVWANGGWRDTLAGTIAVSGSTYVVSFGGVSEVFVKSGSTFTPASNNGSTLTQSGTSLTLTASDGTQALYSTVYSGSTSAYQANGAALMAVYRPNGERLEYFWDGITYCSVREPTPDPDDEGECLVWANAVRLEGVRNNRGYQINFKYASDEIPLNAIELRAGWLKRVGAIGINLAIDYCSPYDNTCTGTRNWPQIAYAAGPFGGQITSATDQSGRTTTYSYSSGQLSGIRLPGSTSDDVSVSYTSGKASQVISASGTWNYAYADSGTTRTTTATGPNSQSLTAVSNLTIGRATSVKDALNQTTSYQYDTQSRLKRVTQPEGNYVELTYDSRGNVTQTLNVPKSGSGLSNITTSAAYASSCTNPIICNLPSSTTDARGAVTNYTYDATHGGLLTITQPAPTTGAARPETRITYAAQTAYYKNSAGTIVAAPSSVTLPTAASTCASGSAPACVGTTNETRTVATYGSAGVASNLLPTAITNRDGTGTLSATSTMTYTPNGDVASVDGPLSGTADTTTYRYDDARQPVGVIGPDPDGGGALLRRAQRVTYNPRGAVILTEQGTVTGLTDPNWAAFSSLQQVSTAYDTLGRPTHQRLQAGGTTYSLVQTSYDASGRPDCVTRRMNPTTFASPPASACTLAATAGYGPDRAMRYQYDEVGRLKSSTSGYGSGTEITERATYTANGKPLTLTDGKGNVSTLAYDGFDRLSRMRYPNASGGGSSTTDFEAYDYDPNGNVTKTKTRAQAVTTPITYDFNATYDALNRQTLLDAPAGMADTSYTYDNFGRLLTANNGVANSQTWDALGRLTSETGPLGTMGYQYDLAGRRTRQTWPDAFYVTNSWNLANEMTAVLHGGTTQIVGFSYDNLGRRTGISRSNGVGSAYGYDGASRLTSLSHDVGGTAADVTYTYAYNPAGQITSKTTSNDAYLWTPLVGSTTYTLNGLNQVTAAGGAALSYDNNGNLTNDGTRSYAYDPANRLTGSGTATLSYDALGRLDNYIGTQGSRYLYDGVEAVGFASSGTTINTRFIRGPGVDEVLASYTSTGSTPAQFWLPDERGSLVDTVNGSTGVSTAINTYDEYGNPGSGNVGRFQYTGQLWLPSFGAYYYKARAYQPALGRFLQTDPIGYQAGMNIYAYVANDPINLADPLGLTQEDGAPDPSPGCSSTHLRDRNTGRYIEGSWAQTCPTTFTGGLFGWIVGRGTFGGLNGRGSNDPGENRCASPSISQSERAAAQMGNRAAFWSSRLQRGDPLARTATAIVNNTGSGRIANDVLATALIQRNAAAMNPQNIRSVQIEVRQIGVELLRAHVAAVDASNGNLSAAAIAQYHFDVFSRHDLPPRAFGGSTFFGKTWEASITSWRWMDCR